MMIGARKLCIFTLLVLVSFADVRAQANDKWLEDYAAIKQYMSEAYANLEWAIDTKKLDLVKLDAATTSELKAAKVDAEARSILNKFVLAFGDGHLRLVEETANSNAGDGGRIRLNADTSAGEACSAIGVRLRLNIFSLPFERAPGYRQLSAGADQFQTAVFTLANGKRYGIVRIGLFSPTGYLANCTETWAEFSKDLKGDCDDECIDRFYKSVEDRLTQKLTAQVRTLLAEKIDRLIVDIGGNGGGTNWVGDVARLLSPKPVPRVRSGFIRHEHWAKLLAGDLAHVKEDLLRKDLKTKQRRFLTELRTALEGLIAETRTPCDRSYVWTGERPERRCSGVIGSPDLSKGVTEAFTQSEFQALRSHDVFDWPVQEAGKSIVSIPLIVLVDAKTASASENFASWMQYNKAADIVGETTYGAGCGYVNGGTRYYLPNSKLRLRMPDCVRYRADGVNEVSGILPDPMLWNKSDDRSARLEKLLDFLTGKDPVK